MTGPIIVFSLCCLTSALCAVLLFRAYAANRAARLLLWCALCFALLAVNNTLVLIDIITPPTSNLLAYRQGAALAAVIVLIYGFVWETE